MFSFNAKQIVATLNIPNKVLNNGYKMPMVGLGTDRIEEVAPIKMAIEAGYKLIDTSPHNELLIGEGLQYAFGRGLVKREEMFINAKVSEDSHTREEVKESLSKSLARLGLHYVDMYLLHEVRKIDIVESWKGMEDVLKLNMTRSIGVTNVTLKEFDRIWDKGEIKIANVEVEVNPRQGREGLVSYSQDLNIVVSAHSPLAGMFGSDPRGPKYNDPLIVDLANRYNKSAAQILLRYLVNRDVIPLPRAEKMKHLLENLNIFDFSLSSKEVTTLTQTYNVDEGIAGWKSYDELSEEALTFKSC